MRSRRPRAPRRPMRLQASLRREDRDDSDDALREGLERSRRPRGRRRTAMLYVDLHLVHEVTSPQAFDGLRARGLRVRRPDLTIATTDHSTPTTPRSFPIVDK